MWLARLVGRIIPEPDLVILLDAPPNEIERRKRELPRAEVSRQVQAYRSLLADLRAGRIVDAAGPVSDTVAKAEHFILDYLAHRSFDLIEKHRDRVLVGLSITAPASKSRVLSALESNASTILERMD